MSVKVNSIGLKGLEGYRVQVEVQVTEGLESVVIVGLPDASVKESKERVSSALHHMGYPLVDQKVVINLSPAEQKKNGPLFDLAIALGILKSIDKLKEKIPQNVAFIGAVSLDGTVVSVEGMLPAILSAKKLQMEKLYLPYDPDMPDINISGLELIYISSVQDVITHLSGQPLFPFISQKSELLNTIPIVERDFKQIIGHNQAKRALEIAAAGAHHIMMDGPPGCGKSLLAETFPTILPELSNEAQLEKVSLYQLAGAPLDLLTLPPFRHPHHSSSSVAIIGGGSNPKPGEVSLAHNGVLFLDELAEFTKKTLDMLRQPLENGKVTISRAHSTVTYPAKFIFIAAMNPCPCGYLGSNTHYCTCTPKQVHAYQTRVSGPIRDRIDIVLSLKPVVLNNSSLKTNESSKNIQERVIKARKIQVERYGKEVFNGSVLLEELLRESQLSSQQQSMLQNWGINKGLSNRVQIKLIRLARTIADLKGNTHIENEDLWEALTLRREGNWQSMQGSLKKRM